MANILQQDSTVFNTHTATVISDPNFKGNNVGASKNYPLGTELSLIAGGTRVQAHVTTHNTVHDREFTVSPALAKRLKISKRGVIGYFVGGTGPLGDPAPGTPQVPGLSDLRAIATAIQDSAKVLVDFFNALFDPHFWISALKIVGGGLLILLAFSALIFGRGPAKVGKAAVRRAATGTSAKVVTG